MRGPYTFQANVSCESKEIPKILISFPSSVKERLDMYPFSYPTKALRKKNLAIRGVCSVCCDRAQSKKSQSPSFTIPFFKIVSLEMYILKLAYSLFRSWDKEKYLMLLRKCIQILIIALTERWSWRHISVVLHTTTWPVLCLVAYVAEFRYLPGDSKCLTMKKNPQVSWWYILNSIMENQDMEALLLF